MSNPQASVMFLDNPQEVLREVAGKLGIRSSEIAEFLGTSEEAALYAALGTVLAVFLLLILVLLSCKKQQLNTISLVGLCGAGKTSLFYKLRDNTLHNGTVTSMGPNEDHFILYSERSKNPKARPIHVIDIPGHPKLRGLVDDYLPKSKGIVFVVDGVDIIAQQRAAAELLYDILTKKSIVRRRIPMLIVCNKVDMIAAHTIDFIRKQLEKELEKLRGTRTGTTDADMASDIQLGVAGEPFKFAHAPIKVAFAECSAMQGKLDAVEQFMRDQVRP